MSKISYCPCCGYDFRNKDWVAESELLMRRYSDEQKEVIKLCIRIAVKYTTVFPKDIYTFLQGVSIHDPIVVASGCKVFITNKQHHTKGLHYAKSIISNLTKNEKQIRDRMQFMIGGRSVELADE